MSDSAVPVISMRHTSAWPLALIYGVLIVFASLFPFDGWRAQGIDPQVFLFARIPPPYWTWFDVNTNIAGYVPLGFLLALACCAMAGGCAGPCRWRPCNRWCPCRPQIWRSGATTAPGPSASGAGASCRW